MKPDERRRTASEWVARYELEPSLVDVFTEGADDKLILEAFFRHSGMNSAKCFEISDVHMPSTGAENNNRTRLLEFSQELAVKLKKVAKVACVVDRDFDSLVPAEKITTNLYLFRTDYACMEMYFFTPSVVEKINTYCLKSKKICSSKRRDFLERTLMRLFVFRYINSHDEWKLGCVDFEDCVNFKKDQFEFDETSYINKYLGRKSRMKDLNKFLEHLSAVELNPDADRRMYIHGHDFKGLLAWMINKMSNKNQHTDDSIYDVLKMAGGSQCLVEQGMFRALAAHLT